jgi:hypothetical protein
MESFPLSSVHMTCIFEQTLPHLWSLMANNRLAISYSMSSFPPDVSRKQGYDVAELPAPSRKLEQLLSVFLMCPNSYGTVLSPDP